MHNKTVDSIKNTNSKEGTLKKISRNLNKGRTRRNN